MNAITITSFSFIIPYDKKIKTPFRCSITGAFPIDNHTRKQNIESNV